MGKNKKVVGGNVKVKDKPRVMSIRSPFEIKLVGDYVAMNVAAGHSVMVKQINNDQVMIDTFTYDWEKPFKNERDGKIFQHG